ncbi:MAG: hypothetical protein QXY49_07365 [Thermofilaceae archaeon]
MSECDPSLITRSLLEEGMYQHIAVLVLLYREKNKNKDEIMMSDLRYLLGSGKYLASNRYAESIVKDLKNLGLLNEKKVKKFRFLSLTRCGEEVSKLLNNLIEDVERSSNP